MRREMKKKKVLYTIDKFIVEWFNKVVPRGRRSEVVEDLLFNFLSKANIEV